MELNGLYARLYSMQFRNPEEELAVLLENQHNGPAPERKLPEKPVGLLDMLRGRA
jgi:hypothetical protein